MAHAADVGLRVGDDLGPDIRGTLLEAWLAPGRGARQEARNVRAARANVEHAHPRTAAGATAERQQRVE